MLIKMLSKNLKVWYDGKILPLEDATISVAAHPLHYGTSVFEGIRAYKTDDGAAAIFRLKEHIERLFFSANSIGMELDFTIDEVCDACHEVLNANNRQSGYIRPVVFYDDSSLGFNPIGKCKPKIAIITWDWEVQEKSRVKIASVRRISELSLNIDAKVGGHYVNSVLASKEAQDLGYDIPILLDHNGYIAEGPIENIFFVKGKKLFTPKKGKILQGITRSTVVSIANDLGYEVTQRNITPHELDAFDGAFFCGTAAEFATIKQIGSQMYDETVGSDIKKMYEDLVHARIEKYKQWNSIK